MDRRLWSGLGHAMSCCWLHSTGFPLRIRAPAELGVLCCADSSPHTCAMTLRCEAPNGATQSQSLRQPLPSRAQATVAAPARCWRWWGGRVAGWMLVASLLLGAPPGNQEDGRMGTPTGCCWQAARWDSTTHTVSKPSPQPPRRLPCMGPGVWITGRGST